VKHETVISGLRLGDQKGVLTPTILAFREKTFIKTFLSELRQDNWQELLNARKVDGATTAVLEQPVHRAFHLVVVDARCISVGMPRLDGAKIINAGFVIRRLRDRAEDGWMFDETGDLGWQAPPADALDLDTAYDPDASMRMERRLGKNKAILAQLERGKPAADPWNEDVVPLFQAPPDIVKSTGMTLLFGFLPLSSDQTEPEQPTAPPFSLTDVQNRLAGVFKSDRSGVTIPPRNVNVTASDLLRPEAHPSLGAELRSLKSALMWLGQETGAFSEGASPQIKNVLNQVQLSGVSPRGLFDFLEQCFDELILQSDGNGVVHMPDSWPALTAAQQRALEHAGYAAMASRWANVAPLTPRYPTVALEYKVRCFFRMEDCEGCPPRIVWSFPSAPYSIKPWYAGSDGPPQQIEMPPVTVASLKSMKPNVAFNVPPELQQHMDRINMADLVEGKHTKTGIDFGMICGFSIPIITICAFIVLQIFLQLLNIIFFWLPFIRICIPYPKIPNTPPAEDP